MIRRAVTDDAVVAHLQGGLGNQLFQYAAVGAAARRADRPLLIDASSLGARAYALEPFPVEAELLPDAAAARMPKPASRLPWRRRPPGVNRVVQDGLGHGPQLDDLPLRAWVSGYWQSYLYFEDQAEQLRATFSPARLGLSPRAVDYAGLIEADVQRTVAVHVRRGDYVSDPAVAAAHGVLGLDHFRRGLELAAEDGGDRAVVFSDDIAWVREHLDLPDAVFVEPAAGRDHEDLALMTLCARHVLSNSSFSWWGAWLAGGGGLVVAPAQWTRTLALDVDTLLPPAWVRLKTAESGT